MEFLGRQLDAVLRTGDGSGAGGGSTVGQGLAGTERRRSREEDRPRLARVELRRGSSQPGSIEEALEAGGSTFYVLPSGAEKPERPGDWEEVGKEAAFARSSASLPGAPRAPKLLRRMRLGRSEAWLERAAEASETESNPVDGVKTRLRNYIANVRYGPLPWNRRPATFDEDQPIWLLGKFYHNRTAIAEPGPSSIDAEIVTQVDSVLEDFQRDFASRIWLTYRRGFPPLEGTELRSDAGWGCMLRSAQMILAQALLLHFLGRDWSRFHWSSSDSIARYRAILSLFGDGSWSPLSLHNLVRLGSRSQDKAPGDWYGPGSVALVLRHLFASSTATNHPLLSQLAVYVARDCAVYEDEIEALCSGSSPASTPAVVPASPDPCESFVKVEREMLQGSSSGPLPPARPVRTGSRREWRKALLLFVPLRLGTTGLNLAYANHLKTLLSLRNCLGLIGGKPKHSMYFLGFHADSLIYLDPHFVQDYEDLSLADFEEKSFQCQIPRRLQLGEIDPSCAVGFYARSREEWRSLVKDLSGIVETETERDETTKKAAASPPAQALFSILRSQPPQRPPRYHSPSQRDNARSHGFELL